MPTLIFWWEALRALEVAKWQQKYHVDWDATDGRNGGARQTVWAILMEMERISGNAMEEDQGAVALVLDLAKALGRVSFLVVWAWATHFSFSRKILRVLCGYVHPSTRGECSSKDVRRSRYGPSRPSCQGQSGVACSYVLCCRMR